MGKMAQKLAFIFLSLITLSTETWARNIRPVDLRDPHVIKVIRTPENKIEFELCLRHAMDSCEKIGARAYSLEELRAKRKSIKRHALGVAVLDLGLATGGYLLGGAGALGATVSLGLVSDMAIPIGCITGFGSTLVAEIFSDTLNPVTHWRLANRLLSDEVLGGKDVEYDVSLSELARDLEDVLFEIL